METTSHAAAAVVMTFNLRRAIWTDGANAWRYRKARAAEAIRAAAADFVGTQEGSRPMLEELASGLDGFDWLGEGRRGGERDETSAVLYRSDRWTPEESGTFWLSETPHIPGSRGWGAAFPRICTWALFRSRRSPASRIAVFNTHLDHMSRQARRRGAALIAGRLAELRVCACVPAVLTGDFNARPRSEALAPLERAPYGLIEAYGAAHPGGAAGAGATYHGFRGGGERGRPIDAIFATDDCVIEEVTVDRRRYGGRFPSDHYPVRARVRWTPLPR